jgi:RNA polymerase sigma factor for flagellar operon FliA
MEPTNREALIEKYAYLVHTTCNMMTRGKPQARQREEGVKTSGFIGLIKAIDRFDDTRGVQFVSFAVGMIRSHILEQIREEDPLPRLTQDRRKRLARESARLIATLGRLPTSEELAEAMGLELDTFYKFRAKLAMSHAESLEKTLDREEEQLTLRDTVSDPAVDVAQQVMAKAAAGEVKSFMKYLPSRECLVLERYYWGHETLLEIARSLGISESRVHQIQQLALSRLRQMLVGSIVAS